MVGRTYVYEDVCDMPLLIRSRHNYTQRWRDREIKQQQGISINILYVHQTIERRDIGEKRTWKMRDKTREKEGGETQGQ